jgi:hypothetical protein
MAPKVAKLGPGTLTLGDTATSMDVSCQLVNGVVAWDNDTGDDITVLCGDKVPGSRTYTSTFSGTFLEDIADETGLVAYTWTNKGTQVPFEYVPTTDVGAKCTGTLIIDPLDFGSTDDYGSPMQSDFEWDIVGDPVLSWGAGGAAAQQAAQPDTGSADQSADQTAAAGV